MLSKGIAATVEVSVFWKNLIAAVAGIVLALGAPVAGHAETYTYMCKVGQGVSPVTFNEDKNTLTWRGETYELTGRHACRDAWTAKRNGVDVKFCTQTQGGAELTIGSDELDCHMPNNPSRQSYQKWLED
jgi:hypothetical protein